MWTGEHWKTALRTKLREALVARQTHVLAVVRETLSALENAEAPPAQTGAPSAESVLARSQSGLGSSEVTRLTLTPEAVTSIIDREIRERREAVHEYERLGRDEEAKVLRSQIEVLVALAADRHSALSQK